MSAKKQTTNKKKTKASKKEITPASRGGLSPRIKSILYVLLAIVFFVMFIFKGERLWTSVRSFFFGIFGLGLVLFPPMFIYLTVLNEKEKTIAHFSSKIILCSLTILFGSALMYFITGAPHSNVNFFACVGNLYLDAFESNQYIPFNCGFIGGLFGYPLAALCGKAVGVILNFVILAALILILTNLSIKDIARAASKTVTRAREAGENRARVRRERQPISDISYKNYDDDYEQRPVKKKRAPKPVKTKPASKKNSVYEEEYYDDFYEDRSGVRIDIPYDSDKVKKEKPYENFDGQKSEKKERKPIRRRSAVQDTEVDYVERNEENAADKNLSDDLLNIISRASRPMEENAGSTVEHIADSISQEKLSDSVSGVSTRKTAKKPVKKLEPEFEEENEFENIGYNLDESIEEKKPEKVYHFPPVQLLRLNENNNDSSAMEELRMNSKKLIDTLTSFGVNAKITNICRGPSVTRYELQPAPGVKISKITNLSDDIALNLAANGVRIEAPIPGKAAVGIEVPNKVVSLVTMRELIDSDEFRRSKSKLSTVLGRDISGEIVIADLAKMPHLLIAGTTGSGKSVCVNSILISILYKATPNEAKLLLIDPKMVEFSKYKGIPHLLVPVVSDAKKAAGALAWAVNEMLQRYKIFSEYDCKDIDSYNSLIEKNLKYIEQTPEYINDEGETVQPVLEVNGLPVAKEKMSRVVIAIDELADLMMAAPSEVEDSICRLAQMARAAGMHLILATQRPTVNVITGLIKANVPSRISLKVSSNMDSRTILDVGGGEKLIGKGDMLFAPVGAPKPIRVQGCYATEEEIEGVTNYIKKAYKAEYNAEIEESIKRIAAEEIASGKKGSDSSDDDGLDIDSKMDEAIQCVIEAGQASTSLIQRRLKVGYARAGRMIDDMERLGVVGPHQGSKPRDVMMTYSEWLERRNVLQNHSEE